MCQQKAKKYEAVRWMMMFAIGVTVGLVGALEVSQFPVLDSNMLQMTRRCCLHVSFRWACLWISLYASSPKSSSLWLVIVSFNMRLHTFKYESAEFTLSVFNQPQRIS